MDSDTLVAVLDIGTSSIRASAVDARAKIRNEYRSSFTISSTSKGFAEFDPNEMLIHCRRLLEQLLADTPCAALAITNQRASTVVFDPRLGQAVAQGISWLDLRTAPMCIDLREKGLRLSPNQSATKVALILDLLDTDRSRGFLAGTIDGWITHGLTGSFYTDHTNAAMTGLVLANARDYDEKTLQVLNLPREMLARLMPSIGYFGEAKVGTHQLPLVAILGDQQASMMGQAVTKPGSAKATFGTGAMVNLVTGASSPSSSARLPNGTYPVVARSNGDEMVFGLEGIGLNFGSAVKFACDNLFLANSPQEFEAVADPARNRYQSEEIFVPGLSGLGTPYWDFGALGTFANLTTTTSRSDLANAVLIGLANHGADLVDALETDGKVRLESIRVDGGMSRNRMFLDYFATLSGKHVEVALEPESTTVGAGLAGHLAIDSISSIDEITPLVKSEVVVKPQLRRDDKEIRRSRKIWQHAVEMSRNSVPELTSVTF